MASNDMKAYTLCSMNDLIEQGLMSQQTHYKSHWGRFLRSYDQTDSVKAPKETSWSCR